MGKSEIVRPHKFKLGDFILSIVDDYSVEELNTLSVDCRKEYENTCSLMEKLLNDGVITREQFSNFESGSFYFLFQMATLLNEVF